MCEHIVLERVEQVDHMHNGNHCSYVRLKCMACQQPFVAHRGLVNLWTGKKKQKDELSR